MAKATDFCPGCECPPGPANERCTKSGWIRCNERLAWLAKEAKKHGLSSWADMNARTNKPYAAALQKLKKGA